VARGRGWGEGGSSTHTWSPRPTSARCPDSDMPWGFHTTQKGSTKPGTTLPAAESTSTQTPQAFDPRRARLAIRVGLRGRQDREHPAGTRVRTAEKEAPATHRPGSCRGRVPMADTSCGLVKHPNGEFGLVASWGVLRGEAARAEGVAGAWPSLPRSAGARGRPRRRRLGPWPSYAGRSGRAAVWSEVKRLWPARVSRRQDSSRGIPLVPGAPRGGPWGRPAAWRAQRLAAMGAPRAFASILRTVPGGGERRGRLWRASAACRARGAAPLAAPCSCARVDLGRGEPAGHSHSRSRLDGCCFHGPVNASGGGKQSGALFISKIYPCHLSPVSQSQQPGSTCPKLSNFIITMFYSIKN
jgi:hypothetical protein